MITNTLSKLKAKPATKEPPAAPVEKPTPKPKGAERPNRSEPQIKKGHYSVSGVGGQILRDRVPFLQVDLAGDTQPDERDEATKVIVRLFNDNQRSEDRDQKPASAKH